MQRAAREHHGAADRRAIGASPEFGKHEIAALIVAVEIDGDGEAAMLRAGVDVVAVAEEMPAQRAVVARHHVAIHARRRELEIALDRRQQAARDLIADRLAQVGERDDEIAPALEPVIDHRRGLAVRIEQEPRFLAPDLVVKPHQEIAEREVEHPRHDQRRRGHRHAARFVDRRQAGEHLAHGLGMTARVVPRDIGDGAQHRIEHDGARRSERAIEPRDPACPRNRRVMPMRRAHPFRRAPPRCGRRRRCSDHRRPAGRHRPGARRPGAAPVHAPARGSPGVPAKASTIQRPAST